MIKNSMILILAVLLCFSPKNCIKAQNRHVTMEEAIRIAILNNKELETYRLKAEQSRKLRGEAFDPGSTDFYYSYDENNVAANDIPLKVLGVAQSFNFPTVYISRLKAARSQAEIDRLIYEIKKNELAKEVSKLYQEVLMIQSQLPYYRQLDSLYASIMKAAERRYFTGESSYLESLTTRSHALQLRTNYINVNEDLKNELQKLQTLIQSDTLIEVPAHALVPLECIAPELDNHNGNLLNNELIKLSDQQLSEQRNLLLPGISLEYFQGTNNGENAKIYPGFSVGISIPLFFGASNARIQSAKIEREISTANALNFSAQLKSKRSEILSEIRKYNEIIKQYNELGKETSQEIMKYARVAYDEGEIDFHVLISNLEDAFNLELNYLDNLYNYNQAVLELNYLNLEE